MRVLITGGSGFLARGIVKYWPENEYVLYSRDEYKQDMARQVLNRTPIRESPVWPTTWILGDICDFQSLVHAMQGVDLVIHTAAVKYIPEAEFNVHECVRVNLEGSNNVIEAAITAGVKRVVGISTDKAVQPVNTYGLTKALMERLFAEANRYSDTIFTCTRYGNVVGSTGSVLAKFADILKAGGVLSVTDPTMTRYWQSVSRSVELIRIAAETHPGAIVIPKGESMTMGELAKFMANGYSTRDYFPEIKIIGTRPGEKMHESLLSPFESIRTAEYDNEYILQPINYYPNYKVTQPFELTSDTARTVSHDDMDNMLREARCISY